MARYDNPGKVDVERVAESILDNGGGMSSKQMDGCIHHTAYSRTDNRRISWNEYPDGSVREVHSSDEKGSYMQYGN